MTLNQLRYFCTAARLHSITQAAKALFVTQPTISIAIRDLEKEFAFTLFSFSKNSLELTKEGEEFYKKASYILQYAEDMQVQFSEKMHFRPTVRLGIPPMLGSVFFPELMDRFHEEYPDIYLELSEFGSVRACSMIQDEQLDVGLVNMEMYDIDKFEKHVLSDEKLLFCVSKDHALAKEKEISMQQLDGEPLILFNHDSVQNRLLTQQFHTLKIKPRIIMHCSQIMTTLKFVRQGRCGCFFFSCMLPQLPELIGVPVTPSIDMKIGLVWKKGKYVSAHTESFIRFCRKYYAEEIAPYKSIGHFQE